MLGTPVVPERDRVRFPSKAVGPLWLDAVLDQETQQVLALGGRNLVDPPGKGAVDVN